jgi:hypothetical protein
LFLILACGAGVHRIDVRTGTDELWVPQHTQIMANRDMVGDLYGSQPEWQATILSADDGNVLTPAGLDAMWDLQEKMAFIPGWNATCLRLERGDDEDVDDASSSDAAGCAHRGVTQLWCNRTHYDAEVTSASDPPAALMTIINTRRRTCAGAYVERLRLFGAPTYASGADFRSAAESDAMTGAAHAHGIHLFDVERDPTGDTLAAVAEGFEALMRVERSSLAARGFRLDFCYVRAFDKEISRSVTGDIPLVVAAFVVIGAVVIETQRFRRAPHVSFATLTAWGMCAVGLSVFAGYGAVMWAGVPFTSLAQVGPFIFLGVGVDDVIVLLDSFRLARVTLRDGGDVRSRAEFAAERAGVSVAITSATNFLAFALGSMTVIPAVHWFCVYAAVAILCDFLAQMSVFLAIVLVHETRDQAAGIPARAYAQAATETAPLPPPADEDEARAIRDTLERASRAETKTETETTTKQNNHEPSRASSDGGRRVSNRSGWDSSAAFDDWVRRYADFLMRPGVRVAVACAFCGYAAFALARGHVIEGGLPRATLAPDDSFLQGYFDINDETFEAQVGVEMQHHVQGVDHASPETQATVLAAWATYLSNPYAAPVGTSPGQDGASSSVNWLTAVLAAGDAANVTAPCGTLRVPAATCAAAAAANGGAEPRLVPAAAFASVVDAALAARPDLASVVRRRDGDGAVIASYFTTRAVAVADDYPLQLEIYRAAGRFDARVGALFAGATPVEGFAAPRAFTYHETLVYWQQEAVLWRELVTNLSFAGTGVFIVCVFALAHPAAIIAVAAVGIVDVFLFASLVVGGIRFNVISMINLVMAVGLSVDYTLHVCHAFLATPGTDRVASVKYTLRTMGKSVLKGGGTTLVGTLPMAFSRSTIFRTFFALLFSTVVYGMAVGLVLIPVVLSLLPMPRATHLQIAGPGVALREALDRMEEKIARRAEGGEVAGGERGKVVK